MWMRYGLFFYFLHKGEMMNKMNGFIILFSALSLFLSEGVLAADVEGGVVTNLSKDEQRPSDANGDQITLSKIDKSNFKKTPTSVGGVTTAAAATGISYYQIYVVSSSTAGNEYVSSYQSSTAYDHGGSVLKVYVIQYGYGNPNAATMNGISRYPSSSNLLCGSMSSLHYCNVGETVTGWLYGFDFSGQNSGSFLTSANSTASPYSYWSDSIFIR